MSLFFRIFQHLLPRSRTWSLTTPRALTSFFEGLSGFGQDARVFIDNVYFDVFPQTTRELDAWDRQFGFQDNAGLTEQQRRDRLEGVWRAVGGQDPRYIQDTLQDAGFNLFVYDWWEPSSRPAVGVPGCAVAHDPRAVLNPPDLNAEAGEMIMQAGETLAEAGTSLSQANGFALIDAVRPRVPDVTVVAGSGVFAGETESVAGFYASFRNDFDEPEIPDDPAKWPFFLYIGGAPFGSVATVPIERREELETLVLGIRPAHVWLGMLVQYA